MFMSSRDEVFYVKKGRRYVPVARYDSSLECALTFGDWHIHVSPYGSRSYKRMIEPSFAGVEAAMKRAEEAMRHAMHQSAEFKPKSTRLSEAHQKAYTRYQKAIPAEERETLWAGSINDGIDAAMNAIRKEILK